MCTKASHVSHRTASTGIFGCEGVQDSVYLNPSEDYKNYEFDFSNFVYHMWVKPRIESDLIVWERVRSLLRRRWNNFKLGKFKKVAKTGAERLRDFRSRKRILQPPKAIGRPRKHPKDSKRVGRYISGYWSKWKFFKTPRDMELHPELVELKKDKISPEMLKRFFVYPRRKKFYSGKNRDPVTGEIDVGPCEDGVPDHYYERYLMFVRGLTCKNFFHANDYFCDQCKEVHYGCIYKIHANRTARSDNGYVCPLRKKRLSDEADELIEKLMKIK